MAALCGILPYIQLSKILGRRTPTRVADGRACSHEEFGMGLCR
jgi:hypothetical protein